MTLVALPRRSQAETPEDLAAEIVERRLQESREPYRQYVEDQRQRKKIPRRLFPPDAGKEIAHDALQDDEPANPLSERMLGGKKAVRFSIPLHSLDAAERAMRLTVLDFQFLLDQIRTSKKTDEHLLLSGIQQRISLLNTKLNGPGMKRW